MAATGLLEARYLDQAERKVTDRLAVLGSPTRTLSTTDPDLVVDEWNIKRSGLVQRTRRGDSTQSVSVSYIDSRGLTQGVQVAFEHGHARRAFSYQSDAQTHYPKIVGSWAHFKHVIAGVRIDPIPRVNTSLLPQEGGPARKANPARR